ncbi:MAG: hypothetical protein R2876_01895 [Eubacteriales bacterium]
MLEIILVWLLCRSNSKKAKLRGKSGGMAIAYTIILWFGLEFLGAIIGTSAGMAELYIYLLAFAFAGLGAVISWLITVRNDPIEENTPQGPNENNNLPGGSV